MVVGSGHRYPTGPLALETPGPLHAQTPGPAPGASFEAQIAEHPPTFRAEPRGRSVNKSAVDYVQQESWLRASVPPNWACRLHTCCDGNERDSPQREQPCAGRHCPDKASATAMCPICSVLQHAFSYPFAYRVLVTLVHDRDDQSVSAKASDDCMSYAAPIYSIKCIAQ